MNKGGTALTTPFAELTRQRAFLCTLRHIHTILPLTSAATTLGLSRSPARCPGSLRGADGGVPVSFEKMELFLTASFSHSDPAPNGAV